MSKNFTKEDVIHNKKEAIQSLNNMLERLINDPSEKHLKKANLISYWIKDYIKLINFEEHFDPTKNISYKRGNIVKLNFGFNIGAEYGGLHYGVVLDNKNSHNSPVITVIPLTSIKEGKNIHSNSVDLGNEIYRSLKIKYDTISKSLKDEQEDIKNFVGAAYLLLDIVKKTTEGNFDPEEIKELNFNQEALKDPEILLEAANKLVSTWKEKEQHNKDQQQYLDKIGAEISRMKEGSVALVNQITTVSKMRIFDPRNLKGVLANISLSEENMEKINKKVKELYVFK